MRAKVLKMDGNTVKQTDGKARRARRSSAYAEDQTAHYVLMGKDERSRPLYFIRIGVTGLRHRLFGPFQRKGHAIEAFDAVLSHVLEAFCNVSNEDMAKARSNNGQEMFELPSHLTVIR